MAFTKEQWWIVDSTGRRIGYLYPEDFSSILESFYGDRRWVTQFASDFGFARSTVDRWKDGRTPIPQHVAMILNMLSSNKTRGVPLTPIDAPWLPVTKQPEEGTADAD